MVLLLLAALPRILKSINQATRPNSFDNDTKRISKNISKRYNF